MGSFEAKAEAPALQPSTTGVVKYGSSIQSSKECKIIYPHSAHPTASYFSNCAIRLFSEYFMTFFIHYKSLKLNSDFVFLNLRKLPEMLVM